MGISGRLRSTKATAEADATEADDAWDVSDDDVPDGADGRDASDGDATDGRDISDGRDGGGESVRRPGWFWWAVAVTLLLALAGGTLQVMNWRARHSHQNGDRALTDTETTAVVIGDVSNGLSKIFSYAPNSTATTEQAAADVLGGAASSEYRTLFAQVKEHAAAEHLTLTTSVVRAGVTHLSGDTAQLLVFLNQTIVRKDTPKGTTAAAQLSITARLDSGHWRIVEIHAR